MSFTETQPEFNDRDIWTNQLEGLPVGQQIDNTNQLLTDAATDDDGIDVLQPTREQERQGRRDYDWNCDPDLDHPRGMTLAAEDRMLGQEREMARHRDQDRSLTRHLCRHAMWQVVYENDDIDQLKSASNLP